MKHKKLPLILILFVVIVTTPPIADSSFVPLSTLSILDTMQEVFPTSDGSQLRVATGQTSFQQLLLLKPVLDQITMVGCPEISLSNVSSWSLDASMFKVCLFGVLGTMTNEEVRKGGAIASYVLDTRSGTIRRAPKTADTTRTISILSSLLVVMLVAFAMTMFNMNIK